MTAPETETRQDYHNTRTLTFTFIHLFLLVLAEVAGHGEHKYIQALEQQALPTWERLLTQSIGETAASDFTGVITSCC